MVFVRQTHRRVFSMGIDRFPYYFPRLGRRKFSLWCAPIGGYDDIEVVRAVKLGGVASGDRMEPSAVATNTQQATYAIPGKKTSGCGLLLPWLLWI